jgi:transcriptional regulator with XRE-family HTH domain
MSTIYDPRYKRVVQRLIKARLAAGLTQEELAQAIGLSQPDISKIEKCQRRIDILEAIDWGRATRTEDLAPLVKLLEHT